MNAREITLTDADGEATFRGYTLVDFTWRIDEIDDIIRNSQPRWTDLTLYKVTDPESPSEYILHIVARSLVYHRSRAPGICRNRGVSVTVGVLKENDHDRYQVVEPCDICSPVGLAHLDPEQFISVEVDRSTIHACATAKDVVDNLRDDRGNVRQLGARLLDSAAIFDAGIANARKTKRRI